MTIGSNIRKIRIKSDMTQEEFGRIAGVSAMAVSQWENDRAVPRMGAVERISEALGIPKGDIVDGVVSSFDGFRMVPLYGSIAAGIPIEMVQVDDEHPIPGPMADRYPDAFLLRVAGDSMDKILPNGCYALVDPCDEVTKDGEPYAVCINGFDATIKRVRRLANGFQLVPDSTDPTYAPQTFNFNEPDTQTITVIGRVVWYVIPFDWTF